MAISFSERPLNGEVRRPPLTLATANRRN